MSGGRLVVLDRLGREVKRYSLETGLATIGSDVACDIRVMLPTVSKHHATVSVHNAQSVVRNVGGGQTLVNCTPVSVAALRHGDVITLGDRRLRWEYYNPTGKRGAPGGGAPAGDGVGPRAARSRSAGAPRRATAAGGEAPRDRDLQLVLELQHRASMPASTGGKQVAVVQPQRRDTNNTEQTEASPQLPRRSFRAEDAALHAHTTKAALWIHSRKNTPRNHKSLCLPRSVGKSGGARRSRPHSVGKIQPPLTIDHTKRAAIMLMTGHAKHSPAPAPSFVVKKPSPVRRTPARRTPARRTPARHTPARTTATPHEVSVQEITSSPSTVSTRSRSSHAGAQVTPRSLHAGVQATPRSAQASGQATPRSTHASAQATPRKSALKDGSRRGTRKADTITFDLSNLEHLTATDDDITLHYSDSTPPASPSPRKSLRPSSSRPPSRRDSPASLYTKAGSANSTLASTFATRTSSPRKNMESYSIVDLVSLDGESADGTETAADSTDVFKSVYDSVGSVNTTRFGTPRSGRKTRSTIDPTLVGCSTPYVDRRRADVSRSLLPADDTPLSVDSGSLSRSLLHRADGGTVTPDNVAAVSPATTPVLDIRSFLDDSGKSNNPRARRRRPLDYDRKTIGVVTEPKTRSKNKSKSLGFTAKKVVLRLSRRSPEASVPAGPAPALTPPSSAPLLPEAVKNKHSTAKKPQSKRSIIDTLNRSDMVKQLFNSPVKRKLSQSMTEFSRKLSIQEERSRRPLRHTFADVPAPSPPADRSDTITPDRFVSPSVTSAPSPDFTGVERLFDEHTPENDSRQLSGGQKTRRTPRPRRSIRNDLTNVSGMKALFGRSPPNRLSDVRGVKRLFAAGPRDDLSDVRGVRATFRRAPRDRLSDVSGVEELFADAGSPRDASRLFDRLVGKPLVRAVYSKSFINKKSKKSPRRNRSLHTSVEGITADVEGWLRRELDERLHKSAKVEKELSRLATDTVGGERPIVLNRTRNSSVKKSASEIYEARTLPIKKRSLVESSRESSVRGSKVLPIKKRVVVHSTPMKGRVDLTMNGSELGRVSPISALEYTRDQTRPTRRSTTQKTAPVSPVAAEKKTQSPKKVPTRKPRKKSVDKTPPRRTTRGRKQGDEGKRQGSLVLSKKSPALAPAAPAVPAAPASPPVPRSTRRRNEAQPPARERVQRQQNTSKAIKPKTTTKTKSVESPKRGRRTRANATDSKVKSPRKETEREKVENSPEGKKPAPRGGRRAADRADPPARATRARGAAVQAEPSDSPPAPAPRRAGAVKRPPPKVENSPEGKKPAPRGGRRAADRADPPARATRARGAAVQAEPSDSPPAPAPRRAGTVKRPPPASPPAPLTRTRRGAGAEAEAGEPAPRAPATRKRKAAAPDPQPRKLAKMEAAPPLPPPPRADPIVDRKAPSTRARKNVSVADVDRPVRSRRKRAPSPPPAPPAAPGPARGHKTAESKDKVPQRASNKRKQTTTPAGAGEEAERGTRATRAARGRTDPRPEVVVTPSARSQRARRR